MNGWLLDPIDNKMQRPWIVRSMVSASPFGTLCLARRVCVMASDLDLRMRPSAEIVWWSQPWREAARYWYTVARARFRSINYSELPCRKSCYSRLISLAAWVITRDMRRHRSDIQGSKGKEIILACTSGLNQIFWHVSSKIFFSLLVLIFSIFLVPHVRSESSLLWTCLQCFPNYELEMLSMHWSNSKVRLIYWYF
jgi:hypothetical protein